MGKKHLCEQNSAQRTNDELLLKKTQQTQKKTNSTNKTFKLVLLQG
jgi:hypothetical protein